MTQIKESSPLLKNLQNIAGKQLDERENAIKSYKPSPIKCDSKTDISKEPTAEDILLMEEYSRGVYQGD